MHWTQTPQGKIKIKQIAKNRRGSRRIHLPQWHCDTCNKDLSDPYYHRKNFKGHVVVKIELKKEQVNGHVETGSQGDRGDLISAYLLGKIEEIIATYAQGAGVSAPVLTARISKLLLGKARGQILGTIN